MPRQRNEPLTAAQRALAAELRYLTIAGKIARRYARAFPRHATEFFSEARLALCQAARTFDPGRKLTFANHATHRIEGAMLDVCRAMEPHGFRRRSRRDAETAPRVVSLSTPLRIDGRLAYDGMWNTSRAILEAVVLAGEDPVGWEADYQERLAELTRSLPPQHRAVLRMMYGRADLATMKRVGWALGISESRVSQLHGEAMRLLGEA